PTYSRSQNKRMLVSEQGDAAGAHAGVRAGPPRRPATQRLDCFSRRSCADEGENVMRIASEGASPGGRISRRALLQATLAATAGSALLACQPAPEPRPGASAAGSAGDTTPAGSTGSPAAAVWDGLVQAARREGRLVLAGPPTPSVRTEVPAAFK